MPLAVEPEASPLEWVPSGYQGRYYQPGTPGRTFPSASMLACPRHASGPSPSPISPSKRPLPIHSTRCATYTIVVTVASESPVTTRVPQASCRTVPSAQADEPMPASGPRRVRGPSPSPIRPSKRPLPIHSTRCATCHGAIASGSKLYQLESSTPGQLPDRPVGLGRRADAGIGPTARPRPIAVADSPIEAATPDSQHPLCLIHWCRPP